MDNSWMSREKWDSLVRGENCPLCAEVASTEASNEYGYFVTDLNISRLRLCRNQYVSGYCVLVCHKHVREPWQISNEESRLFFADMMLVGRCLERIYSADKMNIEILGNSVPHLHCHIVPRYYGDPAPGRTIDPNAESVVLTEEEYQKRISRILAELTRQ